MEEEVKENSGVEKWRSEDKGKCERKGRKEKKWLRKNTEGTVGVKEKKKNGVQ